jgi:hypothetical protein
VSAERCYACCRGKSDSGRATTGPSACPRLARAKRNRVAPSGYQRRPVRSHSTAFWEDATGNVWVRPDTRRLAARNDLGFQVGLRGKGGGPDLRDGKYEVEV